MLLASSFCHIFIVLYALAKEQRVLFPNCCLLIHSLDKGLWSYLPKYCARHLQEIQRQRRTSLHSGSTYFYRGIEKTESAQQVLHSK